MKFGLRLATFTKMGGLPLCGLTHFRRHQPLDGTSEALRCLFVQHVYIFTPHIKTPHALEKRHSVASKFMPEDQASTTMQSTTLVNDKDRDLGE